MHGKLCISMVKDWLCWIIVNLKEIILENRWQIDLRILYVQKPLSMQIQEEQSHAVISVPCEKQSKSHSAELMIM